MKKCDIITQLINEWYSIISSNYNYIDDSPSIKMNNKEFIEHRHDQSVFNLLVKKFNLINYELNPSDWGYYQNKINVSNNYKIHGIKYPIWSCRNNTGESIIDL
jgi:hypothetical protein